MLNDLSLSIALDTYDRTLPLINGTVEPEGISLRPFQLESPERHRRMLKHTEFDICELSFGSYLASHGRDSPFTAIPVFTHRLFRQSYYFINMDAGIDSPSDLEGASIGLRRWQNTAALWMRGIARDYYDVDLETVSWHVNDEDEIPVDIPAEYDVQWLDDDEDLNEMLVAGDLDAAMYPQPPSSFLEGREEVGRLFPDYKREELTYFQKTGLFPLMHVIVIQDDIVEEHPWVPVNIRKAFEEAKHLAISELDKVQKVSIVWAGTLLEEQRRLLGEDPWPNGVEPNRPELEAMLEYAHADGMIAANVEPEDLFIDSSVEELPGYV